MAPATELKIASRPMNTTMIESTGALCSGLRINRSITTPMTKESATARMKAAQKLKPQVMSCQLR
jgi:hypothetical protein